MASGNVRDKEEDENGISLGSLYIGSEPQGLVLWFNKLSLEARCTVGAYIYLKTVGLKNLVPCVLVSYKSTN